MGRFKIYDPKKLVNILSDSNYAKCLLCERKLKNVMGNIKRHYEQMHSLYVSACKTMKSRKRKRNNETKEDDKDYIVNIRPKRVTNLHNQNDSQITKMDIMNLTATPLLTTCTRSALVVSSSESAQYHQLGRNISKQNLSHVVATDNKKDIKIIATPNEINPINSLESHIFPETKSKKQIETPEIVSKTKPTQYSQLKRVKHNEDNEDIKIPCYSFISSIQIDVVDSINQLEFLKCLVETKTHVNIPLETFQKADTFKQALETWKPNFQFNYSTETIGDHIDRMAKKLRFEITKMAANRLLYLKLDIVTSVEGNVLFINIQFIKDFEFKIITLSAFELSDDDLATFLKKKVLTILERYKIDIGRVHSITKDNSNNVRVDIKSTEGGLKIYPGQEDNHNSDIYPHTNEYCQHLCNSFPGHAIHFVASNIIKQLNENISQSRDSIKGILRRLNQSKINQMPKLDNNTSWFSVYDMIESLLKIREIVENNNILATEVDWSFATKFVTSFKPIVDTAIIFQKNEILTMGDFYREWLLCEINLEELTATNEIALLLLEDLRKRKIDFFENTSFLAALYLDPRFCFMGSMYLSDKQKELAITQLLQIFNKLKLINGNTSSFTPPNQNDVNPNDRYSKLEKEMVASGKCSDAVSWNNVDYDVVKESLEQLQFEERLSFKTNILDYWKMTKYKSPILAQIAETALAAPATQSTINRELNISSINLIRHKRIKNTDNTENLLLLKLNQDLVNNITLEG